MKEHVRKQLILIVETAILTLTGLVIFKYIPMSIWGKYILFDASSHVAWTSFGLYVIWFFVDQNKRWRIPYLLLASVILVIMALQRIIAGEHNEIGVLLGFFVAGMAIIIPRWKEFRRGTKF